MSVTTSTMLWEMLVNTIAEAGTFATLQEAVDAGIVIVETQPVTGLAVVEGGAAVATSSLTGTALELANASQLVASGAKVKTAGATLLKGASGYKLGGLLSMDVGLASTIAAPLAGVSLGANLYEANPTLWLKISQAVLPFCYAENKVQAFLDYVVDTTTGKRKPVVLLASAIISELKRVFNEENVSFYETAEVTDSIGRTVNGVSAAALTKVRNSLVSYVIEYESGDMMVYPDSTGKSVVCTGECTWIMRDYPGGPITYREYWGPAARTYEGGWDVGTNPYSTSEISSILNDPQIEPQYFPPTPGVKAPTNGAEPAIPLEPEEWPDEPVIIPFPGTEPETIPVTPVTPPTIIPFPIPYEPEKYPDPTPEKPDEWPEEEPWPVVIPFPIQPTEPDPDWPEVMPWPLPEDPPEEWPTHPEEWPAIDPWPRTPEQWPEEVPWPETPPDPEEWPEEEPWPDSPQEWPEEVPWPVPWPDDWPETEPWPIKWPETLPYPWPFPYPGESPEPYPDPRELEEPEKQVDPYIDPWPYQWPDPTPEPEPDPVRDPTQPYPPTDITDPVPVPPLPDPPPSEGETDLPPSPIIPLPFSSATGIISVYHPTQQELLTFANWLWVTWQDATIDKIWNNPFDGVITLFELYCTPTDVGRKNIRSGFLDSGVSSETISRYTEINCGSIGVPEYYGNYFDYAPYSKCHIYLPFIGIVELNVDDIVGHGVNVTYRIDEYNGSCIALVTCAKSTEVNGDSVDYSTVMYQFSGNCAVELPISGGSQAAIKAGMIEAAAWGLGSVIGGILGGNSLGNIGQGLAYGAASAVHSVVSAKSSVQHSGSFGSSYGAMGAKKPYIIVTRPKEIQVPNYNELYGYQAHKRVKIGDCTGYIRCREVHVISPTASDEEKAQIEQLLKMGVYITE